MACATDAAGTFKAAVKPVELLPITCSYSFPTVWGIDVDAVYACASEITK